jgi:Flp pilus assembly protein TadD
MLKFFSLFFLLIVSLFAQVDIQKAKELYSKKSYDKSLEILNSLANEPDADPSVFLLISYNLWAKGEIEQAIDTLYIALKKKPNSPQVYIELVKAYISSGRFKGAMEVCEKALEKFPKNPTLRLQKAYLLTRYGKVMTALGIVEELKIESSEDPAPLNLEAQIYLLMGEFEKAELSMRWAISLDEKNPYFLNNLALILEQIYETEVKKDKNKAIQNLLNAEKELEKALSIKQSPIFESNLQRIRAKLKK